MKIVILTQDDPFFLGKVLTRYFEESPTYVENKACVVFEASPYGKKMGPIGKVKKALNTFGIRFVVHFVYKALLNVFDSKNSVAKVLRKYGIEKVVLNEGVNKPASLAKIKSYNPDLLISITGNQIFKSDLLVLAPLGCLNLHCSLLPKYRGIMPSFWVLRYGEKTTGVSVFFVDEGIDSGPILVQKKLETKGFTQEKLIEETKKLGVDAIIESIEKINKGGYELIENNADEATYFSFPTKEDVKVFRELGQKFY